MQIIKNQAEETWEIMAFYVPEIDDLQRESKKKKKEGMGWVYCNFPKRELSYRVGLFNLFIIFYFLFIHWLNVLTKGKSSHFLCFSFSFSFFNFFYFYLLPNLLSILQRTNIYIFSLMTGFPYLMMRRVSRTAIAIEVRIYFCSFLFLWWG